MSLRVFDWDANPEIDSHAYRISNKRANEHLDARTHFLIKCPDGRAAIQLYPPLEERRNFAHFDEAWKIQLSGGIMPVWQYQTA